jgi:hypothetical protein
MTETREYTQTAKKGCRRCGSKSVAWQTSTKTGKWYLTEVFTDLDGQTFTDHRDFHSAYCGRAQDIHDTKQHEIHHIEKADRDRQEQQRTSAHEKREADELDFFLGLSKLCQTDPEAGQTELETRERELAAIQANPPTMDYMVEFGRVTARAERLKVEIKFLHAALDAVTE